MVPFARFKAIYDAQGGRCVESGAPFVFDSKDLFPSPDRIDNNGGYEDGNVRFVVWRVNRCVAQKRSRSSVDLARTARLLFCPNT